MSQALPAGRVTFLMTDVERSTRLWEEHPDAAAVAVARQEAIVTSIVDARGGHLIRSKGEGDSTFTVFADPTAAVTAAIEIQRAMRAEVWPEDAEVRVRAAVHTGEAELRDDDYFGIEPSRCARLRSIAYGGQSICSHATWEAVAGRLGPAITLKDLGVHRLRDLSRAARVFQLSAPDLPDDFPPLRSLGVRHNLPRQRTSFVGRDEDLVAVRKHLEVDRLLTIVGVGGCGKTRLAIEVATEQLERFPDGVFFADLAPVADAHVVAAAVAAAVGFTQLALGTGSGRPSGELLEFLSSRHVLVVLDNCEHVIEACADLVDKILDRCPHVHVLATSREPLDVEGEQTYPLAPLSVGEGTFAEASDAVRLFCDRAMLVRPGFALSPAIVDDVVEICRKLDGIPLGIELAAAQSAHLAPRQIVERLSDRLQLLSGGRQRTERQRTLHAALDWGHDLLTDDERAAFRRVAVFPGTFALEAAAVVIGELPVLDVMRALVAKSLVIAEHGTHTELRYRMLDTVRTYAERKLTDADDEASARDAHRDHFLEWAESIPDEMTYLDPRRDVWREAHNLRAALAWSADQGRFDLVARLASTMNRMWVGDIREGKRWLELGERGVDQLDPERRARFLTVAAHAAVVAIEATDGKAARRAVEAAAGAGPGFWPSLAHGLLCLNTGIRFFLSKDPAYAAQVEELGRRAVDLATEPIGRGLAWFWLAQARVLLEDLDGAIEGFTNGSVSAEKDGDMSFACLGLLAGTLHVAGRHGEARRAAERVLRRSRTIGGALWAWGLHASLPHALELGHRGRHAEAVDFIREMFEEGGAPKTPGVMTAVVIALGGLAVQRGDIETAAVLLEHAGFAIVHSGVRTPVDVALHARYARQVAAKIDAAAAAAYRERGQSMSLDDALALGLRAV